MNVILQDYFFDAFIKRLAKSKYKDNFVFKGGFLLSTIFGIDLRHTMDIDFLLKNKVLTKENVLNIIQEVIQTPVEDNVTFEFNDISEIRKDDEYGGYCVSLFGYLENIRNTVNIDIATGDPITPSAVTHCYKCMFSGEEIELQSYNFETIVAEKLQTVLKRGAENSRCKDFYDLYIISKIKLKSMNQDNIKLAFENTCIHRGTKFTREDALMILDDLQNSKEMLIRWAAYQKRSTFASGIKFHETLFAVAEFVNIVS